MWHTFSCPRPPRAMLERVRLNCCGGEEHAGGLVLVNSFGIEPPRALPPCLKVCFEFHLPPSCYLFGVERFRRTRFSAPPPPSEFTYVKPLSNKLRERLGCKSCLPNSSSDSALKGFKNNTTHRCTGCNMACNSQALKPRWQQGRRNLSLCFARDKRGKHSLCRSDCFSFPSGGNGKSQRMKWR